MSLYDKASLVLIPSGTKAGTVYSQKPTSGDGDFDFTRSTYATRVNSQGLIEKERSNLLLQSNTFDTTWSSSDTTTTGGQTGYDGSSDAWLITKTNSAFNRVTQTITNSGVATFSIYAKAGTYNFVLLHIESSSGDCLANFDLSSGTVGTLTGGITSKIESIGSSWYRCSATFDKSITDVRIYPSESGGYTGASGSIYIQDAQLEQGLVATDVIETTTSAVYTGITDNVPRLDYDGDCPSLLLEPQRQNLINYSEYIDNASTSYTPANANTTLNAETSPEGLTNAITMETTGNFPQIRVFFNNLSSGNYTFSAFAKYESSQYVALRSRSFTNGTNSIAYFDVQNGSKGTTTGDTPIDYDIEDYGNGWYRCSLTFNVDAGDTVGELYFYNSNTNGSIVSAVGETSIAYGFQLEEGSYATSYIPTYGTSVTRNADSCSNATTNSTGEYFSVFIDYADFVHGGVNGDNSIIFTDSNDTTIFQLWGLASGFTIRSFSGDSNGNYYLFYQFGLTAKAIVRYDGSEISLFINGVKQTISSPSPSETSWNQIANIHTIKASDNKYRVNSFMLFQEALTDQECIDLTT